MHPYQRTSLPLCLILCAISVALSQPSLGQTTALPPAGEYARDRVIVGFKVPAQTRNAALPQELEQRSVADVAELANILGAELGATRVEPLMNTDRPGNRHGGGMSGNGLNAWNKLSNGGDAGAPNGAMGDAPNGKASNSPQFQPRMPDAIRRFAEIPGEDERKYVYILHVEPGTDLLALIQELEGRPDVAFAMPDYLESAGDGVDTLPTPTLLRRTIQSLDLSNATAGLADPVNQSPEMFTVRVLLEGVPRTLRLAKHSVRSANFKLYLSGGPGQLSEIDAPPVRNYRGIVEGLEGSFVVASLFEGKLQAQIRTNSETWAVQPITELTGAAGRNNEHVVFRSRDAISPEARCGNDALTPPIDSPDGAITAHDQEGEDVHEHAEDRSSGDGGVSLRVCEVAFDVDHELFQQLGSSTSACTADVELVLDGVADIYERQFRLTYSISALIIRTTVLQPMASLDASVRLGEFREGWLDEPGFRDIPRDIAHHMTGVDLNGDIAGVAYYNGICARRGCVPCFFGLRSCCGYGYGLSQTRITSILARRFKITAHELGHNWNAPHCDGDGDCAIMCSGTQGSCSGLIDRFGGRAAFEIQARRSLTCLSDTFVEAPEITTLPTLADGQINVAYPPVTFEATAQATPVTWRLLESTVQTLAPTSLPTGAFREWRADESVWQVQFPLGFPYAGRTYLRAWVSSNGFIDFGTWGVTPGPLNSSGTLFQRVRIAPLWDDLSTDGIINRPEDIYTSQPTPDSFMIRWQGHTQLTDQPVNFAVVFFVDGRVRFDYGTGNTGLTPTVGLGYGGGRGIVVGGYDSAAALTNTGSVLFTPSSLPSGMNFETATARILGTPRQGGQFNARIQVTDDVSQTAERTFTLFIDDPATQPVRILSMDPVPNNQIRSGQQPVDPYLFKIMFNEPVTITGVPLTVSGAATGPRALLSFAYDPATRTAIAALPSPLPEDVYTFTLDADAIVDQQGFTLDGEIVKSALPSGDLVQGGDAIWTWSVIPWWQEFRVNSYITGEQGSPGIAFDGQSNFAIAWHSVDQDGSEGGVYFQRFNAKGSRVGQETRANSYVIGSQTVPDIAMYADGRFLLAWMSRNQLSPTSDYDPYIRRFAADGTPLGSEFDNVINPAGFAGWPAIATRPNGGFVCIHEENGLIGGFAYNADAVATIGWFDIDEFSGPPSVRPRVTVLPDGRMVFVYQTFAKGSSDWQIRYRMYNAAGTPLTFDEGVSGIPNRGQTAPSITSYSDGSFTVTWTEGTGLDGSGLGVYSRHWNAALQGGQQYFITPITSGNQSGGTGAVGHDDRSVFVWTSDHTTAGDVYGLRLDSSRNPIGGQFRVNTTTGGSQFTSYFTHNVAFDTTGNFTVVWTDESSGNRDCRAQYYELKPPTILSVQPAPDEVIGSSSTNQIRINFDQDIVIQADDIQITNDLGQTLTNFNVSYNPASKSATLNFPAPLPAGRQYVIRVSGNTQTGVYRRDPRPGITQGVDDFQVFLDGDWTDYTQPSGDGVEGGDAVWCFVVGRDAPWNGESRLNQNIPGSQTAPVAAGLRDDLFAAAWVSSEGDGAGTSVKTCRFDRFGYRIGCEFVANVTTAGDQRHPAMAALSDGSYVIVWSGNGVGDANGIFVRRFAPTGLPISDEAKVNIVTTGDQSRPAVSVDSDDRILVVWQSDEQIGTGYDIRARVFAEDFQSISGELTVNTVKTGDATNPDVVWLESGGFIVVWDRPDGAGDGIWGQKYVEDEGEFFKSGGEFQVTPIVAGDQSRARIAPMPDGGFVAVWEDSLADGNGKGIFGRRFDAAAVGGSRFIVNETTSGDQTYCDVFRLSGTDLAVVWQGPDGTEPPSTGVYQRRINGQTGAPLGPEVLMNTFLADNQREPSIGPLSNGDFFVVWSGVGPFTDTDGIYGRWYDATPPQVTGILLATVGDGTNEIVLEFSEPVNLNPGQISVVGDMIGSRSFTVGYDSHAWVLTVIFDPPLPPDQYTLTLPPSAATALTGTSFDGDADRVAGGVYTLRFGIEPPFVRGDSDCNGSVNFNDIDCFVAALVADTAWATCGHAPGCEYVATNDINTDGFVNFNDIGPFVQCLVAGACP